MDLWQNILETHPLAVVVRERFGGRLSACAHEPNGCACVLEAASCVRGVNWCDDPEAVGLPDMRPINDAFRDDETRTRCMLPVAIALWDWPQWSDDRRVAWVRAVVLRTVREILPIALRACGFEQSAAACERAEDLADVAKAVADAVNRANAATAADRAAAAKAVAIAADAVNRAAKAAADAVNRANAATKAVADAADWAAAAAANWESDREGDVYAAKAAADRAADQILKAACRIWVEEA